jgi:hypothetical protein
VSSSPTLSEQLSIPEPKSPNDLFWNKSFSSDSLLDQNIQTISSDDEKNPLLDVLDGSFMPSQEEPSDLLQEMEYTKPDHSSELNSAYFIKKFSQSPATCLTEAIKSPMWLKIDRIESEVNLDLLEERSIEIPIKTDDNPHNDTINQSFMVQSNCMDATNSNSDEPTSPVTEPEAPTTQNMIDDEQTLMEIEYNTRMYKFFDDLEPTTSKRTKRFKIRLSGCRKRRRESVESPVPETKPKKERKQRLRVFESEMDGPEPKRRRVGPLKIKCVNPKKLKQENMEKVMNEQKKASKLNKRMRKVKSLKKNDEILSVSGTEDKSTCSDSEKEIKAESEAGSHSSDHSDYENQALELRETSTEPEDINIPESQASHSQNSSSDHERLSDEVKDQKIQHSAGSASGLKEEQVLATTINKLEATDHSDDFEQMIDSLKSEPEVQILGSTNIEAKSPQSDVKSISSELPAKPKPLIRSYIKVNKIGRTRTPSNKPRSRKSKNKVTPFDVAMIHQKFTVHPENLELQDCQVKLENIMSRKLSKYEDEAVKQVKKQTKLFQRLAKRHSLNDLENIRPDLQPEDGKKVDLNLSYADKCKYCKICDRMFALAATYKQHMENIHSEDLDESVSGVANLF